MPGTMGGHISVFANAHLLQLAQDAALDPFNALDLLPDNATGELQIGMSGPAEMLAWILPGVDYISPVSANVTIGDGHLGGRVYLEQLEIGEFLIEDLQFKLTGDTDILHYSLTSQQIDVPDYAIVSPEISGSLNVDRLLVQL